MYRWSGGRWSLGEGYGEGEGSEDRPHVVAIDYGSKRNIFRNLADAGARVTVLPATSTFDEVMAHKPDGFFLSNGPGDPAATGDYAVPVIQKMLETRSEERRVGKEGRSRWAPDQYKKEREMR